MACIDIGHVNCNMVFSTVEREGHKAPRDAYQYSKNKTYLRKIIEQPIAQQENKKFYQNSTEWHSGRTDGERSQHRKLG